MIHSFVPDVMYYGQNEDHKLIKESLYDEIISIVDKMERPWRSCNAKSTLLDSKKNEELFTTELLQNIVWKQFDIFLQQMTAYGITQPTTSMVNCWANVYAPGEFQEVHNHVAPSYISKNRHYHSMFSGIHILHQTGKNKIVFRKTSPTLGLYYGDTVNLDTADIEEIKEGSTIIFPSYLDHFVLPADEHRVTLSFNITSAFT